MGGACGSGLEWESLLTEGLASGDLAAIAWSLVARTRRQDFRDFHVVLRGEASKGWAKVRTETKGIRNSGFLE